MFTSLLLKVRSAETIVSRMTYSKNSKQKPAIYIDDERLAEMFADELEQDVIQKKYILETVPGPGLLTKKLLALGAERIYVYPPIYEPNNPMEQLAAENYPKVRVIYENLMRMSILHKCDLMTKTHRVESCFEGLPRSNWNAPSQITFVGSLSDHDRAFFYSLSHFFAQMIGIFALGHIDFVLGMSTALFEKIFNWSKSKRNERFANSTMLRLIFEPVSVTEIPLESPYCFYVDEYRKLRTKPNQMVIVRLRTSDKLIKVLQTKESISEFMFFVKQTVTRGATLMYLNELVPDGARDVLLQTRWSGKEMTHLKPTTKMSRLTPLEILRVFELLKNTEHYEYCSIRSETESENNRFTLRH